MNDLVRCKKCVLPNNYPFIKFDNEGVCHYCNNYKKQIFDETKLLKILDKHRSNSSRHDCLVGLSGGRDSCYALYLLKKKYGMNPLAYTYHWGFESDMSILNLSNICAILGVEHILRSDNVTKNRYLTSLNCKALLSKIKLGMIPIVHCLDKKFLSIGKTIAKENNIELLIHGSGNVHEQREFFLGFTGVDQNIINNQSTYTYNFLNKLKIGMYYFKNFLLNPKYFNQAFFPNLKSFYYTFFEKNKYLLLYQYINWSEEVVNNELKKIGYLKNSDYGNNQWRMGDTQTAFNNYMYYELAGFSEYNEFRSHQIRQGEISRNHALKLLKNDNKPKILAIKKFCKLIDMDYNFFIDKVRIAKQRNNYL